MNMQSLLGAGNSLNDYLLVLVIYFLFFLFIKYPKPVLEAEFKGSFYFLAALWFVLMFTGNYLFYRLGVMSFLPWLNNFIHSFFWIGVCLTWLYYCCRHRSLFEQIIFFAFTSFIIKMAEYLLLGSWSRDSYLGINNRYAYLITMSLVDGFYPVLSLWFLKLREQWIMKNGK